MNIDRIFGLTGDSSVDGILSVEQQEELDSIQTKAANECLDYLGRRTSETPFPLIAMATGIGKGKIAHKIIEGRIREKPDAKILYIAGTKTVLVDQTHTALGRYVEAEDDEETIPETVQPDVDSDFEERSFLYQTGKIGDKNANVHIATIQRVQSEIKNGRLNPDDYDLVVVDEVHGIGTEKRKATIGLFGNVAGLTATPYRHTGRMKKPHDYGFQVIESFPLPDAQEARLLPPLFGIQIDTKEVVDEIPLTRSGAIDYKALEKLLKASPQLRPYIVERVCRIIATDDRLYKTVIAVNFVWEAQELAQLLNERGVAVGLAVNKAAARKIHTDEIPAIDSIDRYKLPTEDERSIQVLISPYVASEGFDAPFTEVLVWASPTDSSLRYTQYTGRLARRNPGKLFGVVVDCLYQTNQYGWSYNMGMWMKGSVKQLENGFLWLGPEEDAARIIDSDVVRSLIGQADSKELDELQSEHPNVGLLDIQDTDLVISGPVIERVFVGGRKDLMKKAKIVLERISVENHNIIMRKKKWGKDVTVVTEPSSFIQYMTELGVRTREKDDSVSTNIELSEYDYMVTQVGLTHDFMGAYPSLASAAHTVLDKMREKDPNSVIKIKRGGTSIFVARDRTEFLSGMEELGVLCRNPEILEVQETDFPITLNGVAVFVGNPEKHMELAELVLTEISESHPDLIVIRRSVSHVITVCTDKNLFITKMIEGGLKLRDENVTEIQETDFVISLSAIKKYFIGDSSKLLAQRTQALELVKEHYPYMVVMRKSKSVYVTAVTDKQIFIDAMLQIGARLRN